MSDSSPAGRHALHLTLRCVCELVARSGHTLATLEHEEGSGLWPGLLLPALQSPNAATHAVAMKAFQALTAALHTPATAWFHADVSTQLMRALSALLAPAGAPSLGLTPDTLCSLLSGCVAVCGPGDAPFLDELTRIVWGIIASDTHSLRVCVSLALMPSLMPLIVTVPSRLAPLSPLLTTLLGVQGDRRRDAYCFMCQFCDVIPDLTHSTLFWCVSLPVLPLHYCCALCKCVY